MVQVSEDFHDDFKSDGNSIWTKAYIDGRTKYEAGHREHKSKFWTAGAIWYANNLRNEALDSVAYSHHLGICLLRIQAIASRLESGEISPSDAGSEITSILASRPIKEES